MNTTRSTLSLAALTALASLAFVSPPALAQPAATKPAQKCMADLTAFDGRLQKDGYWLHGSGYGYGYPMYGFGYAYGGERLPAASTPKGSGYWRARPGYEVRTLLASANILAKRGDQQACERLLVSARDIYSTYAADLRSGKVPPANVSAWRSQQIATAVAVTDSDVTFRSDQLVGTGVVNARGEDLGSVDDIVMDPQSGKIAYLVIARGGIFGFGEKYVPVPWIDFKATPGSKLMVLASTKAVMDAAPQVKEDQNFQQDEFAAQSQKVNAYWLANLTK
ncbi:MAG: PRC-barrel domain-containing protein [Bacteriovorax sp.]|nr:PRC-barrel domain-containing protein [Rhizobacter sp.]